jgi:hypothetical protein
MLAAAVAAVAHGAGYAPWPGPAQVLRFGYNTGEAIADTDVIVRGPDGSVRQRGRTDTEGRHAFVADAPGTWSVQIDDGLGHVVDARVTVAADGAARVDAAAEPAAVSVQLVLLLLAASVIVNVLQFVGARRLRGPAACTAAPPPGPERRA